MLLILAAMMAPPLLLVTAVHLSIASQAAAVWQRLLYMTGPAARMDNASLPPIAAAVAAVRFVVIIQKGHDGMPVRLTDDI